jgi:hypothetical protein
MKNPFIIEAPSKGIAQSPHLGFGSVVNCDIFSEPGVVKINQKTNLKSTTTVKARINWFVRNPLNTAEIYALDTAGNIYKSTDNGTSWTNLSNVAVTITEANPGVFTAVKHGLVLNDTVKFYANGTGVLPTNIVAGTTYHVIAGGLTADTFEVSASQGGGAIDTSGSVASGTYYFIGAASTHGNGLAIFEDHLIIARDAVLDTYGPLSNTPIFDYNWQIITSDTAWHPMINSKNDSKLYGGAGNYVFSLEETAGDIFEPLVAASFTFTAQALDLPSSYRVKCLAELGENIMVGTWQGSAVADLKIADIFPWNRSDPSFSTPISIEENGVNAMLSVGGVLYVLAGITGGIYVSNGYQAKKISQIPNYVINVDTGGYFEFYPGSIINHKGRLLFGVGVGTTGQGVYSLTPEGVLVLENLISTGNIDSAGATLQIGALISIGYTNYLIGWRDGTSYGIDSMTYRYTSYTAYFDSPLYHPGTPSSKTKFNQLELLLAKELSSGEGVKVQYRLNLTDSWTDIGTYDYTTYGAIASYNTKIDGIKVSEADTFQVRVLLTTGASSSTTPEFIRLILR